MHVIVDRAGQHVKPPRVERLRGLRHDRVVADRDHPAVLDGDAGVDDAVGRDYLARSDNEIGRRSSSAPHSMAQPPSTGRSMPVIWREASLARNRQALATSASLVTRFSA